LAAGLSGNDLSQDHAALGRQLQLVALPAVTSWVSTPSQLEPSSPITIFRSSVSMFGRTSICVALASRS